jgi:hypothetical protein
VGEGYRLFLVGVHEIVGDQSNTISLRRNRSASASYPANENEEGFYSGLNISRARIISDSSIEKHVPFIDQFCKSGLQQKRRLV